MYPPPVSPLPKFPVNEILLLFVVACGMLGIVSWLAGCSPSEPYGHALAVWGRS